MGTLTPRPNSGECDEPDEILYLCIDFVGSNLLRDRLRFQRSARNSSDA
jgi:hypothetical protein